MNGNKKDFVGGLGEAGDRNRSCQFEVVDGMEGESMERDFWNLRQLGFSVEI